MTAVSTMWDLVTNVNRAKRNKEALDDAIAEEEAMLSFLRKVDDGIAECGNAALPSNALDQLGAFRVIDALISETQREIDAIRRKQRDESLDIDEASQKAISLENMLRSTAGASPQKIRAEEITQEMVDAKRKSCARWLREKEELKASIAGTKSEMEQLEKECSSLEQEVNATDEKAALITEIYRMEQAILTMSRIVSIPLTPSKGLSSRRE